VVERPNGGLSVVLADGQSSGRGAKAISLLVVRKVIGLLAEGVRDGAAARAASCPSSNPSGSAGGSTKRAPPPVHSTSGSTRSPSTANASAARIDSGTPRLGLNRQGQQPPGALAPRPPRSPKGEC
jgi:hypothetical protein